MKAIRVGLIRCDLHAIYYATLFARHDPWKLIRPRAHKGGKRRDSWQTGGAHYYHYTYYADPTRMTAPFVEGFKLAKLWDPDPEMATIMSEVFLDPPKVVDRYEDVSDDVDLVLIADCNGDGSDHLKLATPGLEKRVPTFVDKPFAYDIKDAVAMTDLARRRRTPILSLSILRSVPEATLFNRRLPEVGQLAFGTIKGGGTTMAGHIHAISLAQHIFGDGVESVEAMGQNELGFMHLNYGARKDRPTNGVALLCDTGATWHCAFYVSAYGSDGAIHSTDISDFEYPKGAAINIAKARDMVRSGKSPVPCDEMLENVAVASAGRRAQKTGRTVPLSQVWKRRTRR